MKDLCSNQFPPYRINYRIVSEKTEEYCEWTIRAYEENFEVWDDKKNDGTYKPAKDYDAAMQLDPGSIMKIWLGNQTVDGSKLTGINHAINQAKSFINTIIEQKKYEKDKNNI